MLLFPIARKISIFLSGIGSRSDTLSFSDGFIPVLSIKKDGLNPNHYDYESYRNRSVVGTVGNDMMLSAPSLIGFLGTDLDDRISVLGRFSVDESLRPSGSTAAAGTDRSQFGDDFGTGEKLWHRSEGFPSEIHVEAGNDDSDSAVGKHFADGNDLIGEELDFIDGDNLSVRFHEFQYGFGILDGIGLIFPTVMGSDGGFIVAIVDGRFECHDLHFGIRKSLDSSDEFLTLTGKHRSGDDFDPTLL